MALPRAAAALALELGPNGDLVAGGDFNTFPTVTRQGVALFRNPVRWIVPKLKGRKLSTAKRTLKKAHCKVGKVTRKKSKRRPGRVIGQKPKPGSLRPAGFKVALFVAKR